MKETTNYSGFFTRFLALLIDGFVISLFGSSFNYVSGTNPGNFHFSFNGFTFLISAAYYIILWVTQDGQTLGKKAMGIKVIRQDGKKMDYPTAILRFISTYISAAILCLGYLSALFNRQRLTWHDRIAHTYVVNTDTKKRTGLKILLFSIFTFVVIFMITIVAAGIFAYTKFAPEIIQSARQKPQYQQFLQEMLQPTIIESDDEVSPKISL